MSSVEVRQTIDVRTPRVADLTLGATDEDCPSGAAAAFAFLATMGAGVGLLAGALLF